MEKWQLAIEKFLNEYKNEEYFLGAILTGSYATGNNDSNSDIDIYIITNLINNRQYVGQTVKGYKNRFNQHCLYALNKRKECPQLIDKVIKEVGIENFKCELLEQVSYKDKDKKEQYYISKYNTFKKGYNRTIGGDYNPMFDKLIKEKHLKIMQNFEFRKQMSLSVKKAYTFHLRKWFSNHGKIIWNSWNSEQRENCIRRV